ncbi:MAG: LytTR family transcriptional regulator DNA-binding domain-containing protein [Bacteroidales bacterium]|nr:LytTR family transcriptional regulator DNA-binding domain-containing protein [Bacteroidales bacterium]
MSIFAAVKFNIMKQQKTIVTILLNILFCAALLWFFSRNAFLRPYLGSTAKEFLSGLLLLTILYANYFILYPKLYRNHTSLYWLSIVIACVVSGGVELSLGYSFIMQCYTVHTTEVEAHHLLSKHLVLIFLRNLALNFIPYMLRERKQLQQSLETESKVVYQFARMLDVCDDKNNCQHIPIDNVLYCKKNGNETEIHTVEGIKYTRYCTIKYLEQHLGDKEFIRISASVIVPYQYIASCDGKAVTLKNLSRSEASLAFPLDTKRAPQIATGIDEYLRGNIEEKEDVQPESEEGKGKKEPSVPPKEKLDAVLHYIQEHPGCRSPELISHTSFSQTTLDRCLFELKKKGLIEYTGSKKSGGYHPIT